MLKELINQHYADKAEQRDKDHFYVSDAGKCPRKIYFKFKDYPKEKPDGRAMRIFDYGDYTHLRLSSVLTSMGIVRGLEVDIPPQEDVGGRADAIVSVDNELYVVDFKTISHFSFSKLNEPKSDHVKQVELYMHYFDIDKGVLLYEDKNNQAIKEFVLKYDEDIVQEVLDKFERLKDYIEKEEVPPIPEDIEDWRCKYCDFQNACKKVENSKMDTSSEEQGGQDNFSFDE